MTRVSYSRSYEMSGGGSKPFHPIFFILAGMMMGSSNGALHTIQWLRANAESLLVGGYMLAVALYLSWVAVWKRVESTKTAKKAVPQQQPAAPKPVSRVTFQEPTATTDDETKEEDDDDAEQQHPVDLSGAYKLVSNDGFESFLAVQGVPWALRRAANQARPVHRITHRRSSLTIKIEGIIESQTTYIIGGPAVETNVRGRIFEDRVEYLQAEQGILVSKRAVTEDYDVTVKRVLSENKEQITMTSTATFRDGRDPVQSLQIFQRCE